MCLEQRSDVEHYLEVMDQLSGEALKPADTARFIEQVAKEMRRSAIGNGNADGARLPARAGRRADFVDFVIAGAREATVRGRPS